MTEQHYASLLQAIWFVLAGVLGWIGVRIFNKLDGLSVQITTQQKDFSKEISDRIAHVQAQIAHGDNALHDRVTTLDRRVTRVETKCKIEHAEEAA